MRIAIVLKDRIKWDEKYRQKQYPAEPSQIVKEFFGLAPGKKALDIGAGNGRNSLFLAKHGFSVDALDISEQGLKLFAGTHPDIHPICADLDTFDIPGKRYDLIVNVKFLNRRIFPYIKEGLRKGGILIFETFVETGQTGEDGSICRDYLLRKNELLHAFLSLHIIFYKEAKSVSDHQDTSYLASLVAAKGI